MQGKIQRHCEEVTVILISLQNLRAFINRLQRMIIVHSLDFVPLRYALNCDPRIQGVERIFVARNDRSCHYELEMSTSFGW